MEFTRLVVSPNDAIVFGKRIVAIKTATEPISASIPTA